MIHLSFDSHLFLHYLGVIFDHALSFSTPMWQWNNLVQFFFSYGNASICSQKYRTWKYSPRTAFIIFWPLQCTFLALLKSGLDFLQSLWRLLHGKLLGFAVCPYSYLSSSSLPHFFSFKLLPLIESVGQNLLTSTFSPGICQAFTSPVMRALFFLRRTFWSLAHCLTSSLCLWVIIVYVLFDYNLHEV